MEKEKGQEGAVANSTNALSVPKARVLAEVFAPNGKIRVELLPPEVAGGSAEGGSVDLQPLENRVAALEAKPEAEHVDLNPLSERVAALESSLTTAQKVIDWLGGDLLRVTPTTPYGEKWCATRTFPFAVKLPGGIHAYALKKDQDLRKTTDFEMIGNGKDVPAYTPVVLVAKEKKEYVLSPAPYSAPIDTGLMGTLQPLTFEMRDHEKYKYFVLIPTSEGYPQYTIISPALVIPPYRSYLRIPKDYVYKPAEAAATTES